MLLSLKNLKYNESTGADEILNEQIKISFPKMKKTFLKLFNIILETGCFPEEWAVGLIVPIFKNEVKMTPTIIAVLPF